MEEIIEEYGETILMGLSAVLVLVFLAAIATGNIPSFVEGFMEGMCGL